MNEKLSFETEAVRLPLTGIPLAEMLEAINREGKIVHYR